MSLAVTQLPAPDSLPAGLLGFPNWLAWRAMERHGRRTKIPWSPVTGKLASSTDPLTWGSFDQAAAFADRERCDGIGFVFTDTPYVGIDLDHCVDPKTGAVEGWAFNIVARFNSYTEVSPSGHGLHIFVAGTLPAGGRKRKVDGRHPEAAIEVYETGRYFTVTGRRWGVGDNAQIAERTAELAEWHAATFPPPEPPADYVAPAGPVNVADAELVRLASNARNGSAFAALWAGDTSAHGGDDSAADLALCNALAFWTDRDAVRMDALFRQSGLMRTKWDAKRGKETYGQRTIAEAIKGTPEGYGGPALEVDVRKPERKEVAADADRKQRRAQIFRAPTLMAKEFPEPQYAIPGLLPEGLCILAGRPKLGKSWLGLGLGLAVASGGPALGAIEVEAGEVLFMALEDGERRLQRRLNELLDGAPAPERMSLAVDWPRFPEGLVQLEEWLIAHPDARLIVIDTFKRVRPEEKRGASVYGQDYDAVFPVADLAHKYSVSIVIVMHTRKADAEDPLDLISGSLGLSGAADGALVMKRQRGQSDALLSVIDRDAEESEKALRWNIATGGWMLLGDAAEYKRSTQRNEVLALLHDVGHMGPKEVAEHLDKPRGAIRVLMSEMARSGLLVSAGGTYMPRAPRPADIPSYIDKQAYTANSTNRLTGLTEEGVGL